MSARLPLLTAVALIAAATAGGVALAQHAPVVAQDLLIEEQPIAGGTRVTVSDLVPGRDGALVPVSARAYSEARP
jgi:hypothetical protein